MLLILLASLFGVNYGIRQKCIGMADPECRKVAKDFFNYTAPEIRRMTEVMRLMVENRIACKIEEECPIPTKSIIGQKVDCTNGNAAGYDCDNIDLLSFISLTDLGSSSNADGADIWGWTDPSDKRRYAITGQTDGASIVDVTDPVNPEVLCWLQSQSTTNTIWRDMKVNKNGFVYIVADRSGQGLQYLNLASTIATCRSSSNRPHRILRGSIPNVGSGLYTGGTNTHNIALNEESGIAYIVGSNSCSGGLMMVNTMANAQTGLPTHVGCFSSDGYTHDTECIIYNGPDTRYTGHEICFGYNENSITTVDVSNPGSPTMLSRLTYSGSAYTHQGWITPDHQYLLMNDELDESRGTVPSQTTYIVDVRSLTNPSMVNLWFSGVNVIDHNLYIKDNIVYEANYRAGLRVLDINNVANGQLNLRGYFKTWTGTLGTSFDGAWSNYPYYEDAPNVVVVQDINSGLFILDVSGAQAAANAEAKISKELLSRLSK